VLVIDEHSRCNHLSWHIHPEYELVYIKNGNGIVNVGNYSEPYIDGMLVLLGPNIPHSSFGNNHHSDRKEVVIQFSEAFVHHKIGVFPELGDIGSLIRKSHNGLLFGPTVKSQLSKYFEEIEYLPSAMLLTRTIEILFQLSRQDCYITLVPNTTTSNLKNRERIRFTFDYVHQNYHTHISSNQIASELGLTTNSFCKVFKKITNRSFIQFLNEFRIQKSTEFLNEGIYTISEVMYKSGFRDPSYFSKQFKSFMHVTPSEYQHLNNKSALEIG